MKWVVRTFLGIAALGILVVAGAVVLLMTLNPNDHKARISSIVKEKTGRELAIAGDIHVVFYPVLGFNVSGLTLSNPPGFAQKEFLSVGEAQAGVRLVPLLSHKISLSKIRLVEPNITVIRQADGGTNLEFAPKKDKVAAETQGKGPDMDLSVDGVEIKDAKVTYIDRQGGKTTSIDPLNLDFPGWSAGRAVPVSLDMAMRTDKGENMAVKATANVKADPKAQTYIVRSLRADVKNGQATLALSGDVDADMKAQKLALSDMKAGWEGTTITGKASVAGFDHPSVTFDVESSSIDLDALMAAMKPAGGGTGKSSGAKAAGGQILPLDLVRKLTLDGRARIGTLKVAGMSLSDVTVGVKGSKGLITADPVALKLYDGTLDGVVKIDARNGYPVFNLAGKLKDMQIASLTKDKMGQDYVSGLANADFDLNAQGNTAQALNDTAGGTITAAMGQGYINKWQLSRLINQAIAYFETGSLAPNASDKVYFTSLGASFKGSGGVFRNDDLTLVMPKSHALGSGAVSLRGKSVDYTVNVGKGDDPAKFADARHLPIRIIGPMASPHYGIDVEAVAIEALQSKLIQGKKQDILNKALGKLGGEAPAPVPADGTAQNSAGAAEQAPQNQLEGLLGNVLGGKH